LPGVAPVCEHTFVPTSQLPISYLEAVRALKESLMRLVRELDPESVPMEEVIEMLIEIAEFEHAIASVRLGEPAHHASADA
jgi:hypothetical protein